MLRVVPLRRLGFTPSLACKSAFSQSSLESTTTTITTTTTTTTTSSSSSKTTTTTIIIYNHDQISNSIVQQYPSTKMASKQLLKNQYSYNLCQKRTLCTTNTTTNSTTNGSSTSSVNIDKQPNPSTSSTYIGYKDKKILIHGNDVGGISLALFLKKKGISSELIETKPILPSSSPAAVSHFTPIFQPLDRGYFISFNSSSILKEYGVFDSIHRKGLDINTQFAVGRDGEKYGSLSFDKCSPSDSPIRLPFSMTESLLVESLLGECLQTPQLGEGTVRIRKQKIRSLEQGKDGKVMVSFVDTGSKISYDLVVGADPFDYHHSHNSAPNTLPNSTTSTIRQYIMNKVQQTKSSYTLYQFSTIADRPPIFPSIVLRQIAKDKCMLAFPLPNERVAISGAFIRPPNTAQEPENGRNKVYHTLCDFEDLGAHTIVSLQDTAPENMKLERYDPIQLKDYVHGNVCLIGEAADKFTMGSLESYSIGIEDANDLAEILSSSNPNQIEQSLQTFNQQRHHRIAKITNIIDEQDTFNFKGGWKLGMFGMLYLKYFYSSFNQAKLIK